MSRHQDREYKVACFPITEQRRLGLITFKDCLAQMRTVYVEVYGSEPTGPVAPKGLVAFTVRDVNGHMRGHFTARTDAQAYLDNPPAHMAQYLGPKATIVEVLL